MLPFDPKKPLYGFTARFPHAKRQIHVFADERFVYFRPKNAPDDWWGVVMQNTIGMGTPAAPMWECYGLARPHKKSFFRLFYLYDPRQEETRQWQIAWRPGGGYVIPVGGAREVEPAFFRSEAKCGWSLIRASTADLGEQFQREWHDPHADVRAALDWCDLSRNERQWRSIVWSYGGRDELELVAHAGCVIETEWQQSRFLTLCISAYDFFNSPSSKGLFISAEALGGVCYGSSPHRLQRLFSCLRKRNFGGVAFPDGARDEWNLPWAQDRPPRPLYGRANIAIRIEPPTQHERLEAALFLRNWLAQNALDLLDDWFAS